ncbi:MAG: precorrin-8X methylmutase [Pseudomonadota bacterium]
MSRYEYARDPAAIYSESFATVRREANLARFDAAEADIAVRMVHACGHVPIADDVVFGGGFVPAVERALRAGAPIFCDCEMVRRGVIERILPTAASAPRCCLTHSDVPALANRLGTTRSAAAVELWRDELAGAVVLIGNAPTALFALLEGLHAGWPSPAAVIGIPVGFVGAAESKAALAEDAEALGLPFVTVRGRLGGSAVASAVVNAVAARLGAAP